MVDVELSEVEAEFEGTRVQVLPPVILDDGRKTIEPLAQIDRRAGYPDPNAQRRAQHAAPRRPRSSLTYSASVPLSKRNVNAPTQPTPCVGRLLFGHHE